MKDDSEKFHDITVVTLETIPAGLAVDLPTLTACTVFSVMPVEWLWHASQGLAKVESTEVIWSLRVSN